MKKIALVALVALFTGSVTVVSQNQNSQKEKKGDQKEAVREDRQQPSPEKRAEKLSKELKLSDVEKAKLVEFFTKQKTVTQQFMKDNPLESADFKPKLRELRKTQDAELKTIIGDEKFQQLQTIRKEEFKQRKENRQ